MLKQKKTETLVITIVVLYVRSDFFYKAESDTISLHLKGEPPPECIHVKVIMSLSCTVSKTWSSDFVKTVI